MVSVKLEGYDATSAVSSKPRAHVTKRPAKKVRIGLQQKRCRFPESTSTYTQIGGVVVWLCFRLAMMPLSPCRLTAELLCFNRFHL